MAAEDEKAKLYRRLVTGTNDWTVAQRMRVNGFWPQSKGLPADPPDETQRRHEIEKRLAELRNSEVKGPVPTEKLLADERKRRWDERKKVRAAKKAARALEVQKRRDAFFKHKRENVLHLGAGVSAGLAKTECDVAKLRAHGLPVLANGQDLAMMLGVGLDTLRWLTFHRKGATLVHYHRFAIPKKLGGVRAISAPKPQLKSAQSWVEQNILNPLAVSSYAHGFVAERSTVTNATPHVGKAVVINLDLKDFFPTFTFRRVKGLFASFGYSEHVATVLSLLCTEPPRLPVEVDGEAFFVALGDRVLPQGASTSPMITNLLCHRLDARLAGLARRHGFAFTRYADDLTFSGDDGRKVGRLLRSVRAIVTSEGLTEHPTKTKVMRRASRQEVTGLVVNARLGIPREAMRKLRATLHNCAKTGWSSQNREGHPDFEGYLRGMVAYASMACPARAEELRGALALALATP